MTVQRWAPFREMITLRDALYRLFDETLMRPGSDWLAGIRYRPAINLYENDSAVTVEVYLPGIKREEVEITLSGATLVIKGERHAREETRDEHYLCREVHDSSFLRRIALPEGADLERAEATFADGLLKVTFPKLAEPQPRRIELQPDLVAR